jgi:hypothetical protein
MNELDEFWSEKLSDAIQHARGSGRGELADYLELKAANDAVRQAGVEQFFDAVIELATSTDHASKTVTIERESPHNFLHRNANMVGELLRLRYGVRCMTVEAGWTRTPSDGFMRLGALAFARITHFGLPHENAEFVLTDNGDGQTWARVRRERPDKDSSLEELEGHFRVLLDERR